MNLKVWLPCVFAVVLTQGASARVTPAEAARLNKDLTPNGAERAANKDGSIPAWDGVLMKPPPTYKGTGKRLIDPFPQDKPLFTINAANHAKYKDKLCAGQMAMFRKFPNTYKMNVFATRRSAVYEQFVYDATLKNALNADLGGNGEALVNAILGTPFPIPKNGVEPVWNHKVRYRGSGSRRWNNQAAVTTSGDYNLVKLREDVKLAYSDKQATPESLNNVIIYFLQVVANPPRLAGQITLVHETMDQVKEPRRAWQYNPGQRRLRRAPNVGYDNPGTGADGLRTNDQTDTFNGATDRYTWKIVGKREMYIPYNSYRVHSDQYKIKDIVKKNHINQDLPRYELHRTWVVEGNVRPGTSHFYAKRIFFIDEDTWQISLVDIYDRRGELWRWQEAHIVQSYNPSDTIATGPVLETIYDLINNRYLAQAMNNEDEETYSRNFDTSYFDPANVQKQATK